MKKSILFLLLGFLFFNFQTDVLAEDNLIGNARSGLLMEVSTGNILYEKNIHEQVAVASMTKMMSQILILEKVEEGKINWEDKVQISKNAADFGGSQIWLTAGEVMSVKDLMKGISMASANDAIDFVTAVKIPTALTNEDAHKTFNIDISVEAIQEANNAARAVWTTAPSDWLDTYNPVISWNITTW